MMVPGLNGVEDMISQLKQETEIQTIREILGKR